MNLQEAVSLIRPGVMSSSGTWADIGAGTGMFTMALMEILEEGRVIAVDKSPHALYESKIQNRKSKIEIDIMEADFNQPLQLPPLDGIIMANALHYADNHLTVLTNVISCLKPNGILILIEYDTETPNPPWVPYPVSLRRFREISMEAGLKEPELIGKHDSIYRD